MHTCVCLCVRTRTMIACVCIDVCTVCARQHTFLCTYMCVCMFIGVGMHVCASMWRVGWIGEVLRHSVAGGALRDSN